MNDRIKQAAARTKKFVEDHKVGIAVTVTSVCWIAINRGAVKEHDDFLREKGLYDEFYTQFNLTEK